MTRRLLGLFCIARPVRACILMAVAMSFCVVPAAWGKETLQEVMKRRGLSQQDVLSAARTYVPTGKRDEFIAFASGGQSGHVIVYGVPSMRMLKYIAVFTPEPWQAYGFDDESKAVLAQGRINGRDIDWGDVHHPALSETDGDYDGQYLFVNDKANPRIAVIDLHDFETKQIVVNPIFQSQHGGAFVSENTEWVMEAVQYPAPLAGAYVPLERFNEEYRGGVTYWKFNREKGRLEPKQSFSIELPPYSQNLSDFGKGPSSGWSFTNSFCSERYVGGIERGRPPFEAISVVSKSGGTWNESFYSNPRVDELLDMAMGQADLEDQIKTYGEIQCLLVDEVPRIIPVFKPVLLGLRPDVRGLEPMQDATIMLHRAWLDR